MWLTPFVDKHVNVQVKLCDPLTTRAIRERFCGEVSYIKCPLPLLFPGFYAPPSHCLRIGFSPLSARTRPRYSILYMVLLKAHMMAAILLFFIKRLCTKGPEVVADCINAFVD